jgi:hypothetical protein
MQCSTKWPLSRSLIAAFAVPALLALLSAIQLATNRYATDYLLLPPFAVIIYVIFSGPRSVCSRFRSVVVLPVLAAIVGELCWRYLGLTPAGVAIATLAVLTVQALIRAQMPPALALAVLAMLLKAQGYAYVVGVLEGTAIVFVIFQAWCRFGPVPTDARPKPRLSGGVNAERTAPGVLTQITNCCDSRALE